MLVLAVHVFQPLLDRDLLAVRRGRLLAPLPLQKRVGVPVPKSAVAASSGGAAAAAAGSNCSGGAACGGSALEEQGGLNRFPPPMNLLVKPTAGNWHLDSTIHTQTHTDTHTLHTYIVSDAQGSKRPACEV